MSVRRIHVPPTHHDAAEHRRQLATSLTAHYAVDAIGGPDVHDQYMLARNIATYFGWKAWAAQFNGALSLAHSFNIVGVTFQGAGTGTYRIELDQTTILGNPITDYLVPSVSVVAPDAVGEAVFARFQPGAPSPNVDIFTFTLAVSGQDLFDTPYDLGPNDIVFTMGLMNLTHPNHDPLPAAAGDLTGR